MKSFFCATLATLAITFSLSLLATTSAQAAPKEPQIKTAVKVKHSKKIKPHLILKPAPKHNWRKPRHRIPARHVYIGKPYRGSLAYWAHPIASAIAFAILIDATSGALQDEKGNNVVVLGNGGEVKQTYQQDGTVYIITE